MPKTIHHACALALCALVALAAGCASQPASRVDNPTAALAAECAQLDIGIARAKNARRAAADRSDNAWKAVVPFVVLATKASSKRTVDEADRKLADLQTQAVAQGCDATPPT